MTRRGSLRGAVLRTSVIVSIVLLLPFPGHGGVARPSRFIARFVEGSKSIRRPWAQRSHHRLLGWPPAAESDRLKERVVYWDLTTRRRSEGHGQMRLRSGYGSGRICHLRRTVPP